MERIEGTTTRRGGSNPDNPPGRAAANRIIANVSAIWRSYGRYGLTVLNPAMRRQQAALKPRETRIPDAEFADWYATVMKPENPVRRDLQLVALFTGIRSDGVRNLRWEDVDFDAALILVARAKGDRPYSLPMVKTVRKILERRQADNTTSALLSPFGGDHGFVFPSLSRDMTRVIPVAEVKERHATAPHAGQVIGTVAHDAVMNELHPCSPRPRPLIASRPATTSARHKPGMPVRSAARSRACSASNRWASGSMTS